MTQVLQESQSKNEQEPAGDKTQVLSTDLATHQYIRKTAGNTRVHA